MRREIITKLQWNNWTILKEMPKKGIHRVMWCECKCGHKCEVFYSYLKNKPSVGCRKCYQITHGHTVGKDSPTYMSYIGMKKRCYNPNDEAYDSYGGRGVRVCDRWLESFENFLEDMGEKPINKTLDRIKDALIYSKNTCQWSTRSQQNENRRAYGESKFRGVHKTKSGKYAALIRANGFHQHIGTFPTAELASLAFESCKEVLRLSGVYAGKT